MNGRLRNAMANIGVLMFAFGLLAIVALIPALLEIGQWTSVLTWALIIDVLMLAGGWCLFCWGDKP
jgi:hypothetical protein